MLDRLLLRRLFRSFDRSVSLIVCGLRVHNGTMQGFKSDLAGFFAILAEKVRVLLPNLLCAQLGKDSYIVAVYLFAFTEAEIDELGWFLCHDV